MTWVAAAVVGSSVISGYVGSQAAKKAAKTTADATRYAADIQQKQFEQQREDLAPYRQQGYTALSDIQRMMPYFTGRFGQSMPTTAGGYAPPMQATEPAAGSVVIDPQTGRQFTVGQPMDMSLDTTQAYNRAIGATQTPKTAQEMPAQVGGYPTQNATLMSEYLDPSMAFRMKYGTQATERLGNVGGGALSGNTLRALQEFGQGLASTEYGNAFNRAQSERSNIYNTLANIAGMGQGAVNTGVAASQATAQNLGQLAVGGAQAQAAGTIGQANAITGPLTNIGNMAFLSQYLKPAASTLGTVPLSAAPTSAGTPFTLNLA